MSTMNISCSNCGASFHGLTPCKPPKTSAMERMAAGCGRTVDQLYRMELISLVDWLDEEFGYRVDPTGKKIQQRVFDLREALKRESRDM